MITNAEALKEACGPIERAMSNPFVFNLAPTGLIPTKAMNPSVPITTSEIVEQVLECAELGVNMVHLHARDPATGAHSSDPDHYAPIVTGIRHHAPELVICLSTSGRGGIGPERRAAVLDLADAARPDFASLTLSSLNFTHEASLNGPDTVQFLARRMGERGIRPELEVFDLGMANYLGYLLGRGLIAPPYYVNIILGGVATAQADLLHLGLLVRELPPRSLWSGGGMGHAQLTVNTLALAAGGGVRVGLEDNLWLDAGRTRLATNRALVERVLETATLLGRRPYTAGELRAVLGLGAIGQGRHS